jgi:hypothetical protein
VATGIGYCISCGYKFHSLIIKAEKSWISQQAPSAED